ncbi:uncharacterized protein DS421_15g508170 [Arachis hypogaea]|nr:uncharacterized protein DS421_15g508170 [Arachis hypogaea]
MARANTRDRDINRLNVTWHYARTADFARSRLLLPRRVSHTLPPPDAIVPYLREARFGDMVLLRNFVFDNSLITTFVERWRSETYMFHLPWGKATITLDMGVGGAAARCYASGGSTVGCAEGGVVLAETYMSAGPCPPYAIDGRPEDTPKVCEVLLIEGI